MSDLTMIFDRVVPPVPWDEGDNIPWNQPGFSERMLREHLCQDHDMASRKRATIAGHARWIFDELLGGKPGRVLDLACGPGLYTEALAARGCTCEGIDFSPASIRHAEKSAAESQLDCTYRLGDLRVGGFGGGFDLVMLIYGQINVFKPEPAREILRGAARALKPQGILLLEPQRYGHVHRDGAQTSSWYTAPSGLFSDAPHLVLQEGYWDEAASTRTERFFVVDPAAGTVERYSLPTVAHDEGAIRAMMSAAGIEEIRSFPSLLGESAEEDAFFEAYVGKSPRAPAATGE
ncbi:MAG: class I SAM-dependent methyltransferase [Deltaproteobacteria bacterium]|jgi:SAM-dependent methyltransferase|nr:class I SAM-dependent methyltransferase [Deltaproteobacteria bacterium]MBW2533250.1 class I SAM-dependent methyltransferase [Deltaproteobacteria bacterium]